MSILFGLLLVLVAFFAGEIGNRFGRRPIFLNFNLFMVVVLLLIGFFTLFTRNDNKDEVSVASIIIIVLIFLFAIGFNSGAGT